MQSGTGWTSSIKTENPQPSQLVLRAADSRWQPMVRLFLGVTRAISPSPLFSPGGEAKYVRGPSVQGVRRSAPSGTACRAPTFLNPTLSAAQGWAVVFAQTCGFFGALVQHDAPRRLPLNPPAFIPLGGAQAWPYATAARWRSRLRIGHGKGVREQGTEPGTLVTGQLSHQASGVSKIAC